MELLKAPHPSLRTKTKPVTKITLDLLQVAKEMIKLASSFKDPEGVGLSTTQIGRSESFFVAKINDAFQPFFNPQVVLFSKKTRVFFEGCLSVPDYYGEVIRPIAATIIYMDQTGQKIKKHLRGAAAWIVQHEIDHLNGKLFVDRVLEQKGRMFKVVGKDKVGDDIFEEIKLDKI